MILGGLLGPMSYHPNPAWKPLYQPRTNPQHTINQNRTHREQEQEAPFSLFTRLIFAAQMIQPQQPQYNEAMCTSNQSTIGIKRRFAPIMSSSPVSINTNPMQPRQLKRRRVSVEKVVQFNPKVNLRCVFPPTTDDESTWIHPQELRQMKDSARQLAKAHYIATVRTSRQQDRPVAAAVHPTKYERNGDSLRGMEHITDLPTGKLRQVAKSTAIKSVNDEQCRQLLVQVLAKSSTSSNAAFTTLDVKDFKVDTAQLSRAYGANTKAALAYARRAAEEDAREAAAILASDL
jgi:hypothetical protein